MGHLQLPNKGKCCCLPCSSCVGWADRIISLTLGMLTIHPLHIENRAGDQTKAFGNGIGACDLTMMFSGIGSGSPFPSRHVSDRSRRKTFYACDNFIRIFLVGEMGHDQLVVFPYSPASHAHGIWLSYRTLKGRLL